MLWAVGSVVAGKGRDQSRGQARHEGREGCCSGRCGPALLSSYREGGEMAPISLLHDPP